LTILTPFAIGNSIFTGRQVGSTSVELGQLALAGMEQGNLMAVLQDYDRGDHGRVHAVFVGPGQQVPARVRVILDYLLEHVQLGDD
jgi:hypothetical protein